MLPLTQTGLMTGWRNTPPKTAMGRSLPVRNLKIAQSERLELG